MKYFGFLARFVIIPLIIFQLLLRRDRQQGKQLPEAMQNWPENLVLLGHAATAVTYTTPWDNYLVAGGIWSYDPKLVTGMTLGWVPIEEYTFFVLQSLMTGSWLLFLARRIPLSDAPYDAEGTLPQRLLFTGGLGLIWMISVVKLLEGKAKNTYLSLILSWALPPIMLQTGFGGDILWRNRALLAASIIPATLYLGTADSLAISDGTWNITPAKTIEREVIKNLPFEEFIFFFLTNVLLTFGVTLVLSKESENRLPAFLKDRYFRWKERMTRS
ncbi:MAG: lycopene cyclase domain-containing protein [Anaerolineae bacterium]